ncbi:MAG: sn-glycerol-1-phosphate dehydrogenase [Bacteroidales bacterium]|nr:sn-glycerol-1-phosphate dehydrogenase [Bacteroidales bacterium]
MTQIEQALKAADETRELILRDNAIKETARVFKKQFPNKNAIVVTDSNTYEIAGRQIEYILKNSGVRTLPCFIFTQPDIYAEYSFIDQLTDFLKTNDAIPIAVGAGTINDLVKLSSHNVGRRYMCIATAASMDGYTAFGASITANGAKQTFNCPAPQAVIADISIIRQEPKWMTASGYADLFAKITAGADWILAHHLDVEKIDPISWSIVQDGLQDALANPEGAARGDEDAITRLTKGLMLSGFAMQHAKSSRPASGAEHQFSHLWNMEHHTNQGKSVPHGLQVSIGMLAITAFYEEVLKTDFSSLDIDKCCANWDSLSVAQERALKMFADTDFPNIGYTEIKAKYIERQALAKQLELLKNRWDIIRKDLKSQLIPYNEVKRRLKAVGAPTEPEQIGLSREQLKESFIRAQYIRRRFTVLDLAVRTGYMQQWLDALFGKNGIWEIQ